MSTKAQNTSEKLTFAGLLISKDNSIEIPIIQRDYAQGRISAGRVRDGFINTLHDALKSGLCVDLDFVYGTVRENKFIPLDGQQRLTTLFLLHVYLASKENKKTEFQQWASREGKSRFSYLTRFSSAEFCNKLVTFGFEFSLTDTPSETIENSNWFHLLWQNDPTIAGMVRVLDTIHEKFKTAPTGYYDKLLDNSNPVISFQFLNLEKFQLTDDLYIKMNARGILLTPFEGLKARIGKKVKQEDWDKDKEYQSTFDYKADTVWTDIFWKKRNADNEIDTVYLQFICNSLMPSLANTENNREQSEIRILELYNEAEELGPDDFNEYSYRLVSDSLDAYTIQTNAAITLPFPVWGMLGELNSLFSVIGETQATYVQRVLFYAQTVYLVKNKNANSTAFIDWMRVMRNVVLNSTIDKASNYVGAINLINELSQGCDNIYQYLSQNTVKSNFAGQQVAEELLKSKLIIQNEANRKSVFAMEDAYFCRGKISFAFYSIGYEKENDVFDASKLDEIRKVFEEHLNESDITNEFRRGLLTIGDNKFYNYWSTSFVYAVQTPKRCLIEDTMDLRNYSLNAGYRHYLKGLIIQLIRTPINIIIQNYAIPKDMPDWKKKLMFDESLLRKYCPSHYIARPEDESFCYLLEVRKPREASSCKKIE